jgi:hypothetical protein
MPRIIDILLFDGVEEMDFVGQWEVFTASRASGYLRVIRQPVIAHRYLSSHTSSIRQPL